MDEGRTRVGGGTRERTHGKRVHLERGHRCRFGAVDVIESGAVDHQLRRGAGDGASDRLAVGDVERRPCMGNNLGVSKGAHDNASQLTRCPGDEHARWIHRHSSMSRTQPFILPYGNC